MSASNDLAKVKAFDAVAAAVDWRAVETHPHHVGHNHHDHTRHTGLGGKSHLYACTCGEHIGNNKHVGNMWGL